MKTVFDASNNLEAYMVMHQLERAGIDAKIVGEHLQGAVGELPAAGNVRVVTSAEDVVEARNVIAQWEASEIDVEAEPVQRKKTSYAGATGFLLGAALASVFLLWAYNSPIENEQADYDRDGVVDEFFHSKAGFYDRIEGDRNGDGTIDIRHFYTRREGPVRTDSDDDFDGVFEHVTIYRYAQPRVDEIDSNGDGLADIRYHYENGVVVRSEIFDPVPHRLRKTQAYSTGKLVEARWDSNNDGELDTLIEYDEFEEVSSRTPIAIDQ
jgi:hypothetical protein